MGLLGIHSESEVFRDLVSRCHYRPCRHVDIAPTSGLSDHLQAIGLLKAAGKAFEMEQSLTPDLVGASRSLVPRNTHTYVHTDALIAMIRARQQGSDGGAPLAPRRFESDSALGGFVCRLESGSFNASRPKKKERRREPPPKKTTAVLWCAIYAVLALRRTLPCVPLPVVLRLVLCLLAMLVLCTTPGWSRDRPYSAPRATEPPAGCRGHRAPGQGRSA